MQDNANTGGMKKEREGFKVTLFCLDNMLLLVCKFQQEKVTVHKLLLQVFSIYYSAVIFVASHRGWG